MSALGMVVFENDHCTAMIADGGGRLITESGEEIWISYLLPTISMMPPMEPFWPEPRIVMQGSGLVIGGTGRFLKAHGTVEITAFPIPVNPGGPGFEWPVEVALSGSLMSGPGKH